MLALRVDFPLESPDESTTTGVGAFDLRSALEAEQDYVPPFDLPPHDRLYFERHLRSLARYYQVVSEGRVLIDSEVFPRAERRAYTVPQTDAEQVETLLAPMLTIAPANRLSAKQSLLSSFFEPPQ